MVQPNIIVISAAHWRADVLGCAGHPDIRTPHLDALARRGVRYTRAYAASTDAKQSACALIGAGCDSLPMGLKAHGYACAFAGAWPFEDMPRALGFDAAAILTVDDYTQASARQYWPALGAAPFIAPESRHAAARVFQQALAMFESLAPPFLLWLNLNRPALPYDPPAPWDAAYDPESLALPPGFRIPASGLDVAFAAPFDASAVTELKFRRALAHYYGAISHIDDWIGKLVAVMEAKGAGNAAIVFTAATGEAMGCHGIVASRSAPYEPCVRVPFILSGGNAPALDGANRMHTAPTLLRDALLRCAGATALSVPPSMETVNIEAAHGMHIVADGRFKLVHSPYPGQSAFYNVECDPLEFDSLIGDAATAPNREALSTRLPPIARFAE